MNENKRDWSINILCQPPTQQYGHNGREIKVSEVNIGTLLQSSSFNTYTYWPAQCSLRDL